MPVPIEERADDATPVQMHWWKSQVREFDDKTKAFIGFKANVFLKVEGQCTEGMKSKTIRHRDYDAANTKKDRFALFKILRKSQSEFLALSANDKCTKIHQGSMKLMECYDTVKSKLDALDRAGATLYDKCIVVQIAAANGHNVPTDADRHEARDYAGAVRFVLQSNYPKYIAELSNDHLDHENKYPRTLAAAYEILHFRGPESPRLQR